MGNLVTVDVKKLEIFKDGFFKLGLAYSESRVSHPRQITSTFSLDGFVSSKRTIILPWYILAKYELRMAAFVCPMWR